MIKLTGKTVSEIIRFAFVGIVATAVHYAVYALLCSIINDSLAYTVGYVVSFIINYVLSARFTFKKQTTKKNGIGFACAHLFNYLLQVSLLNFFIWIGINKLLAPIPVYCIAVPTNFIIVRFVFSKTCKSVPNDPENADR